MSDTPTTPDTAPRPHPAIDGYDYERARDELVEVVRTLESGGLGLDESVAVWERGEALARRCEQQLRGARDRVDRALAAADAAEPDAPEPDTRQPDTRQPDAR